MSKPMDPEHAFEHAFENMYPTCQAPLGCAQDTFMDRGILSVVIETLYPCPRSLVSGTARQAPSGCMLIPLWAESLRSATSKPLDPMDTLKA